MEQQQRLQLVEIGVEGLTDIRTLLSRWKAVLAAASDQAAPALVMRTYRPVVVRTEHRRPGEEVFLTFLAPKAVLDQFLADLRARGLEVTEEALIPGVVLTCRLGRRIMQ